MEQLKNVRTGGMNWKPPSRCGRVKKLEGNFFSLSVTELSVYFDLLISSYTYAYIFLKPELASAGSAA